MDKKAIATLTGFFIGFLILHPFSMVFQGLVHPVIRFDLANFPVAYDMRHLPMAFFFGISGALFSFMNIQYAMKIIKEKERVNMLESLLPICAYCKKIRDDAGPGQNKGKWHEVEQYISMKTDTTFSHGMCPDCYERVMEELDMEDNAGVRESGQAPA